MSDNQDTKLYEFLEDFRQELTGRLDNVEENQKQIIGAVESLSGQVKDYHQEMLMLGRKVDRLEQAIMHIAQETGVKLKFDL